MRIETDIVFVIDDEESVRSSLSLFLKLSKYNVESYESSEQYLAREPHSGSGCIILDVNLRGKSGLELQEELINRNSQLPVIFITGYGNIQMSVHALKKGAVNYLEKPFNEDVILNAVSEALTLSHKLVTENKERLKAQQLIQLLTPREAEILKYILKGLLNKQIAGELNIVEHTVKLHRRSICDKLGVKSVPEIIQIVFQAGLKFPGKE
jgi:two-component system, LuxR family, response regulator TtrR